MRGLDTNILVRFLTRDDPRQSEIALALIEHAESEGERLHISIPVLSELAWVLRGGTYRFGRIEIADALALILQCPVFAVQECDLVRLSIEDYRGGRGDFSDYLIGRLDRKAGCSETLTFDRRLAESAAFVIPREAPGKIR